MVKAAASRGQSIVSLASSSRIVPARTCAPCAQSSQVVRSSGDARLDAIAARGLRLEIDVMERFPIQSRTADAQGWRAVPLKLSNPGRRNTKVLGCTAKAAGG